MSPSQWKFKYEVISHGLSSAADLVHLFINVTMGHILCHWIFFKLAFLAGCGKLMLLLQEETDWFSLGGLGVSKLEPASKTLLSPCSVSEARLEHTPLVMYGLWLLLCYNYRLNSWGKAHLAHSASVCTLWPPTEQVGQHLYTTYFFKSGGFNLFSFKNKNKKGRRKRRRETKRMVYAEGLFSFWKSEFLECAIKKAPTWPAPSGGLGHRVSIEITWHATFRVCCQLLLLGELSASCVIPLRNDSWKPELCFLWTWPLGFVRFCLLLSLLHKILLCQWQPWEWQYTESCEPSLQIT